MKAQFIRRDLPDYFRDKQEHESIIDALARRRADELAELLQQHLNHKYESLCHHL